MDPVVCAPLTIDIPLMVNTLFLLENECVIAVIPLL